MTARSGAPASDGTRSLDTARLVGLHVWIVVGAIIIGTALLNVFDVLAPVIEFLAVGSLVAFVAAPIVNVLEHHGVSRGIGALVGLTVVVAVVALVAVIVIPMIVSQLFELFTRVPSQLRGMGDWLVSITHDIQLFSKSTWPTELSDMLASLADDASDIIRQVAGDVGRGVFPFLSGVGSQLFALFLGLVLAYWLARDYPRIHREVGVIVGEARETTYRFMVAILARSVGGYMRGTIITSVVDGVLAFAGFALVGHPYAPLMGVLTGILHLIPVVGPVISSVLATAVALFYSPAMAFWTLVVTVIAQNITDNILSPKIMQSAVSVHPAMSLTAIVIGSALLGPLGMVIAIPLSAALKGLFIFYFENRTRRPLVSYDGAFFQGTPYRDDKGAPVAAFDALGDDTFVNDSEIISDDVVPAAEAVPRPELDNPWSKLASLQPGSTGMFRMPFGTDAERGAREKKHGDARGDRHA